MSHSDSLAFPQDTLPTTAAPRRTPTKSNECLPVSTNSPRNLHTSVSSNVPPDDIPIDFNTHPPWNLKNKNAEKSTSAPAKRVDIEGRMDIGMAAGKMRGFWDEKLVSERERKVKGEFCYKSQAEGKMRGMWEKKLLVSRGRKMVACYKNQVAIKMRGMWDGKWLVRRGSEIIPSYKSQASEKMRGILEKKLLIDGRGGKGIGEGGSKKEDLVHDQNEASREEEKERYACSESDANDKNAEELQEKEDYRRLESEALDDKADILKILSNQERFLGTGIGNRKIHALKRKRVAKEEVQAKPHREKERDGPYLPHGSKKASSTGMKEESSKDARPRKSKCTRWSAPRVAYDVDWDTDIELLSILECGLEFQSRDVEDRNTQKSDVNTNPRFFIGALNRIATLEERQTELKQASPERWLDYEGWRVVIRWGVGNSVDNGDMKVLKWSKCSQLGKDYLRGREKVRRMEMGKREEERRRREVGKWWRGQPGKSVTFISTCTPQTEPEPEPRPTQAHSSRPAPTPANGPASNFTPTPKPTITPASPPKVVQNPAFMPPSEPTEMLANPPANTSTPQYTLTGPFIPLPLPIPQRKLTSTPPSLRAKLEATIEEFRRCSAGSEVRREVRREVGEVEDVLEVNGRLKMQGEMDLDRKGEVAMSVGEKELGMEERELEKQWREQKEELLRGEVFRREEDELTTWIERELERQREIFAREMEKEAEEENRKRKEEVFRMVGEWREGVEMGVGHEEEGDDKRREVSRRG